MIHNEKSCITVFIGENVTSVRLFSYRHVHHFKSEHSEIQSIIDVPEITACTKRFKICFVRLHDFHVKNIRQKLVSWLGNLADSGINFSFLDTLGNFGYVHRNGAVIIFVVAYVCSLPVK